MNNGVFTMKLADKIKKIRKEKKISQAELAEIAGINPNHLSRLETDKFSPTIPVLKKMANALEVSIDYLLDEETEDIPDVKIENKSLLDKVRLIDTLDEEDQQAITRIIDSMLTKQKMRTLLDGNAA